jgi:hypothetical protein
MNPSSQLIFLNLRVLTIRFFRILSQTSRTLSEYLLSLPYECCVLFEKNNDVELSLSEPLSFVRSISRFVLIPSYFFSSLSSETFFPSTSISNTPLSYQFLIESFSLLSSIAAYGFSDEYNDVNKPKKYMNIINNKKEADLNGDFIEDSQSNELLNRKNKKNSVPNNSVVLLSNFEEVFSMQEASSLFLSVERFIYFLLNFIFLGICGIG